MQKEIWMSFHRKISSPPVAIFISPSQGAVRGRGWAQRGGGGPRRRASVLPPLRAAPAARPRPPRRGLGLGRNVATELG